MGLTATVLLLLAALIVVLACYRHQRRERPLGEVSLFPSTPVMMVALLIAVLTLAHLVTLLTGVPLKGRMGL